MDRPMPQCTAITHAGTRCKNRAVKGSDPPRCSSHGGSPKHAGAPPGNRNAETHGAFANPLAPTANLDARISDLNRKINNLSAYIDRVQIGDGSSDSVDVDQYTRLLALHGQLTSRLGRLLRDRQQLSPEDNSFLQDCINEALDEVSELLGVKL
jgi:hypothetical protein